MTSSPKEIENAKIMPGFFSHTSPNGAMPPRISIIDVAPSASGLLSLLQEALPVERRHVVTYHQVRMNGYHAINPCGT